MKQAMCALCRFVGAAEKMKGHVRAKELFEMGEIRPASEIRWVFCPPCHREIGPDSETQ